MYYILTAIIGLLALILLVWAANDIITRKKNKIIILLLLLAPIVGPLIYFQTSRDGRTK